MHLTFSSKCQSTSHFSSNFFQTYVENMYPFCSHIPSQPETLQLWVISEITAPTWHLYLLDGVHSPVPHTWHSILQHSLSSGLPCSLELKDNSVPSHPRDCPCLNFPSHHGCYIWFWNFLKNPVCHRLVSSLWDCWEMMEILGSGAMWKEVRSFGECLWRGILWQWSLLLLSFTSQRLWWAVSSNLNIHHDVLCCLRPNATRLSVQELRLWNKINLPCI